MKTRIALLFIVATLVFACQYKEADQAKNNKMGKGMIKVSVLYSSGEGKTFDWDYYFNKHVPMVKKLMGDSIKVITIDKGISGKAPNSAAPYVAMFHMYFESIGAYQNSVAPHAEKFKEDFPRYTNIQPVIQISEVQE